MTKVLLKIYDYFLRHKVFSVSLLSLMLIASVLLGLRLRYVEDVADFLPSNDANRRYTSVYNNLADQGEITIIFRSSDTLIESEIRKEMLMDAVDDFKSYWDNLSAADTNLLPVRCHSDDLPLLEAMDYIRDHFPLFLNSNDFYRMDSLLRIPGYPDSCMIKIRQMMAFPLGGITLDAITSDPLNLFSPVLSRLALLKASDRFDSEDGYIIDDGGHFFAFLKSPFPSSDTRANSNFAQLLDGALNQTMKNNPNVEISAVGAPLIAVSNANQIKRDSTFTLILAVVLIFAILLYSMGRKRSIFWLAFSILFGWLFALAAIALFKPTISLIVIGIGSVLLGIAVNYPLHFLDHLSHHPDRRSALKDMAAPLLTGNITTVSAFACLLFVKAEAMRDLGLFGSLMLVGTIVFVLLFLPHLAKPGRSKAIQENFEEKCEGKRKWKISSGTARTCFLMVCLLTCILGWFSMRTTFDSDLHNINYMTEQQQTDLALLSSTVDENLLYVVSESPSLERALVLSEKAIAECKDSFQRINGPVGIIPSQGRQLYSIQLWNEFLLSHPHLADEVTSAAQKAGFTKDAFNPFFEQLQKTYEPILAEDMDGLSSLCANYILPTDTGMRVVSFLHGKKRGLDEAKKAVNGLDSTVFAFDVSDVGSHLVVALNDDFNFILFVCSFVVFFFLWLTLGRLELAILSFLPMMVGWLWILGLMDIFAVKFNIVNIILATFIFGQGDDYTIFITEGLMYEYAYGRKRLKGYRRSVVISAILMFVGIGVLMFAKHPALRSLAEVAVIGMATVLLMACYLPPLIFRWLTKTNGQFRDMPLTIKRLAYTAWMMVIFFVAVFVVFSPFTLIYRLIGKESDSKHLRFHRIIYCLVSFATNHIPGVHFHLHNPYGESFEKPAVIVANHLSHLDLLCIFSLTPNLIVLTNDWVWKNPLYRIIIRYAECCPTSNGFDNNLPKIKSLLARGYSVVVFPEGTRSSNGRLGRFHKGAFLLAQECKVDIIPLYIQGTNHVMPKGDNILREGSINVEIGLRIASDTFTHEESRFMASQFRADFQTHLIALSRQVADEQCFLPLVKHQYLYKGSEIARRAHRTLRLWQQGYPTDLPGQGEIPLLIALAHPDKEFEYLFTDEDDFLVASNCAVRPSNLHYRLASETQQNKKEI